MTDEHRAPPAEVDLATGVAPVSGSQPGGPTRILLRDGFGPVRRVQRYRLVVGPAAGGGPGRELEIGQVDLRIGSREGNDVVLADPAVSRYHLAILAEPEGFLLRDLESTNGTFVDGYRVREIFLRPGSQITVGSTGLRFLPLEGEFEVEQSSGECCGRLLGRSLAMREVFATVERVAPRETTVLIEGESGTGKELCAEAIHRLSPRGPRGPLVVFDCAAAPANLVESELFGHERGAFTGAVQRRIGRFEEASGGTLFLDEIGELPLELQPKLLRVIERREVRRVGGSATIPVDVRLLAATNRDLAREVNRGTFREDLYFRLAVVRLRLPPLRERRDDIPLLVSACVRDSLGVDEPQARATVAAISPDNWKRLAAHPWPGNVRELRNFVERMLSLADPEAAPSSISGLLPTISPAELAAAAAADSPLAPPVGGVCEQSFRVDFERPFAEVKSALVGELERRYLTRVLERNQGNLSRAAAAAGLDRMYFKRLLRRSGGGSG